MPRTKKPVAKRAARRISDPRAELAALHDIGAALGAAWDLNTTLHKITETTAQVMRMDSCSIYLFDKKANALVLKASTGLSPAAFNVGKLELGEGITGQAALSGKPIAVRDAPNDPRFKYVPGTEEQKFKSLLAVPVVSQGVIIGAMNVQTKKLHVYSQAEQDLLSLIGELAAGALERAVLHDNLQRQINELSTLAQVSQTLTAPLYLDEMLMVICEMAAQLMQARACALLLLDQERGELMLRATYGLSKAHVESSPLQVQNSLTGQVILRGEPVMVPDVRTDPRYRNRELAQQEGLYSFLGIPLRVRGQTIGAFTCYMDKVHAFAAEEIELFTTLANQTALAIENANLAMNSMLVREMHHRIKNNLQMVAMLLRLQLREADQVAASAVLQQTITRILSIAAVHEALSQEGFRLIGVRGLIQQAAMMATQNMVQPGKDVRVVIEGDDIRLTSQPATTLAIAANELIQNALEHGFGSASPGKVQVLLRETADTYEICVQDDGVGLPVDFDRTKSLGLQIVETLVVEDLRGDFAITSRAGQGTTATVRIPKMRVTA